MTKAELEARRDELANDEASLGYEWAVKKLKQTEPSICYEYGVKAGFKLGWDSCAAILQGEMDAYSESMRFYMNELQSANAKLAVAKTAIEFYADGEGDVLDWDRVNNPSCVQDKGKRAREALSQIAAMDASEGKGKE